MNNSAVNAGKHFQPNLANKREFFVNPGSIVIIHPSLINSGMLFKDEWYPI